MCFGRGSALQFLPLVQPEGGLVAPGAPEAGVLWPCSWGLWVVGWGCGWAGRKAGGPLALTCGIV